MKKNYVRGPEDGEMDLGCSWKKCGQSGGERPARNMEKNYVRRPEDGRWIKGVVGKKAQDLFCWIVVDEVLCTRNFEA